jgi:hypothetical protein
MVMGLLYILDSMVKSVDVLYRPWIQWLFHDRRNHDCQVTTKRTLLVTQATQGWTRSGC